MRAIAAIAGVATETFDLENNENPLGPSPAAIEAIRRTALEAHRYPDNEGEPLREALAEHYQLSPTQIALGNGSNGLVDFIARQWAVPGSEVIVPCPSFLAYSSCTIRSGARLIKTGLVDWQFDLETILDRAGERTSLIILANPNNPTGMQLEPEKLERWFRAVPEHILIVLDEAYEEFSDNPGQGQRLLAERENLLVLRTFSKAYGLAGLRIGYALGHAEVVNKLQSQRQRFHVNRIAQAAAVAALGDRDYLARGLQNNREGRQRLCAGLRELKIGHLPSSANFVLIHCGRGAETAEALKTYGVLVKPLVRFGLPEFVRASIGLPQAIDRLLTALKDIQRQHSWFPVLDNNITAPPQPNSGDELWRY